MGSEIRIDYKKHRVMMFPDARVVGEIPRSASDLGINFEGLLGWGISQAEVGGGLRLRVESRRWG